MSIPQTDIDKIVAAAKLYGANRIILFGSSALPDIHPHDIDLACDGIEGWKLYEFASFLEEELHKNLDIVPLTPATSFTRHIESQGIILL